MRVKLFLLAVVLSFNFSTAQTIYEEFDSYKLNGKRQIKIQLPRNYEDNIEKAYPLFVVFDGDYLFEAVAGK